MRLLNNLYQVKKRADSEDEIIFTVSLIPDCEIYKAHFPGMPVTPGACIIQMVKELLENITNASLEIISMKNVKFLSIITPSIGSLEILIRKLVETDNGWNAHAVIKDNEIIYAKLSVQTEVA